jgi:hypothetical protein
MAGPSIALRAHVEPAVWPADALTDVSFLLVLSNQGRAKTAVYPGAAKLSDVASMAGVGIAWQLHFRGAGGPVPQQELRQWHGPPGNPPSPTAVMQSTELVLAPSASHEVVFGACWIPNARLTPAHLDPIALDPTGMDNVRSVPLGGASLLVFGQTRAHLEPLMAARPDFLRATFSTVVAFFPSPGEYQLEAAYLQQSWMDIGDKLTAVAPRASVRVAAP